MYDLLIGISSYLPDDERLREKRYKKHIQQIEFLNTVYPNFNIIIVAQNYKESEYVQQDNITYFKRKGKYGVSNARNEILTHFYYNERGYDFLLMLDDEISMYPYFEAYRVLQDILKTDTLLEDIDALVPVHPQFNPFKKPIAEDMRNNEYHKLRRLTRSHVNFFLFRNIYKYYGEKEWFDPKLDISNGLCAEDFDFTLKLVIKGYKMYEHQTLIMKPALSDDSVIFKDRDTRNEVHQRSMDYLHERYKAYGLERKNGRFNVKKLNDMYNKAKSHQFIKREKPIDIFDTLGDEFKPRITQNKLF